MEKIFEIEDYLKSKKTQIERDVDEISKDEFTSFRIEKEKQKLRKFYFQGRYDIEDEGDQIS